MDILIIKVSDGKLGTHFRMKQDYGVVSERVTAWLLMYHPGKTATAYALCDAIEFQAQIDAGKTLTLGDIGGGGDFDVLVKSTVTTETIIPPDGIAEGAIDSGDDVVCYS